jgi:trans-aconitate 2-methyltransferase
MLKGSHLATLAGTVWNPSQYLKFSDHRIRPALELLERVNVDSPRLIYDLGCGSGNITKIISNRWHSATIFGLDNSDEMLAKASTEKSKIQWIKNSIENWSPDELADLIYSNSTLHWINRHEELFPKLLSSLKQGGCLAIQMPLSWEMPSHRLMRETLSNGGKDFRPIGTKELRDSISLNWVKSTSWYYDIISKYTTHIDMWETEYLQVLVGDDPVLEWVKGTGLRPILNTLEDKDREIFLFEYRKRLRKAYPTSANGCTLFPFKRLFMVAVV